MGLKHFETHYIHNMDPPKFMIMSSRILQLNLFFFLSSVHYLWFSQQIYISQLYVNMNMIHHKRNPFVSRGFKLSHYYSSLFLSLLLSQSVYLPCSVNYQSMSMFIPRNSIYYMYIVQSAFVLFYIYLLISSFVYLLNKWIIEIWFPLFQENVGFVVPWIIGFVTFMALEAVAMVYSNVLRDHVNRVSSKKKILNC